MSEIDELQRRIGAALDRIGQGVAGISAAAPAPQAPDNTEKDVAEALAARDRLQTQLADMERDMARLRQSNDQLREVNEALRAANEAQVGDSQLINSALSAEVEALRAAHAASQTEVRAILDALTPLVGDSETEEA
ncbi:hypothetical protein [Pseudooceanicola onchidii]|uniref:hypothetical protein n=1 Tax=Pseudooceanicola onchidii TaxID=2562279 RepID=UPI0010AB0223|nr:hypothetical protein [Pseudooceanicola onchidii]